MLHLEYEIPGISVIYDILDEGEKPTYRPIPVQVQIPDSRRTPLPGWDDTLDKKINPNTEDSNGVMIIDR